MIYRTAPLLLSLLIVASPADTITVGAGSYSEIAPGGVELPPTKIYRTAAGTPAATNDWCSSVLWEPLSSPHFPHPLAVKAERDGLRIAYPGAHLHASSRAVVGAFPAGGNDLTIGAEGAADFVEAQLESDSDWFITVRFQNETAPLRCTSFKAAPDRFTVR